MIFRCYNNCGNWQVMNYFTRISKYKLARCLKRRRFFELFISLKLLQYKNISPQVLFYSDNVNINPPNAARPTYRAICVWGYRS